MKAFWEIDSDEFVVLRLVTTSKPPELPLMRSLAARPASRNLTPDQSSQVHQLWNWRFHNSPLYNSCRHIGLGLSVLHRSPDDPPAVWWSKQTISQRANLIRCKSTQGVSCSPKIHCSGWHILSGAAVNFGGLHAIKLRVSHNRAVGWLAIPRPAWLVVRGTLRQESAHLK